MMNEPALIIHGGTGAKDPIVLSRIKKALASILECSYEKLLNSDAVSAVVEAGPGMPFHLDDLKT